MNYNTGLTKISSKNKVSYFVAVIGVNFFVFVSIFMIVQMIVEEHKPIYSIFIIVLSMFYIFMTFVFIIIRKTVLSDIFIDERNIYMIYRRKIIKEIGIKNIMFVYVNNTTLHLCTFMPNFDSSRTLNKDIYSKENLWFTIKIEKLTLICSLLKIKTIYVNKSMIVFPDCNIEIKKI